MCVKTNVEKKENTAPIANYNHHTEARAVIENKNAAHGTIRTVWYVLLFRHCASAGWVLTFNGYGMLNQAQCGNISTNGF